MYLKALLVWLGFGVIAFGLGTVRVYWLEPALGELRAHQLGTVAVCMLVGTLAWWFTRSTGAEPRQGALLGVLWVALTLAFEFGFFHYVRGIPWSTLLADYRLQDGRLWVLVLLTEAATPIVAALTARK